MHNINSLYSKYSFSHKCNPSSNLIYKSDIYFDNYINEKSQNNKPKRKFDNIEINKIIESCKNNLKRLRNTYINQINITNQNNNLIINDDFKNNNYKYNNNEINSNEIYNSKHYINTNLNKNIDNLSLNNIKNKVNLNNRNSTSMYNANIYEINNFENKNKPSLSRNDINDNLNNQKELYYSEYYNKENNKKYNIYQNNYQGFLSQRSSNKSKNKTNQNYPNKNSFHFDKNNKKNKIRNRNKQKEKIIIIEKDKFSKNYIKILNDLNNLKSTVVSYKKSNIELKKEIQNLNKKIQILSKKNNREINEISKFNNSREEIMKIKEKYYIKKRVNSHKGGIKYNNNESIFEDRIRNMRMFNKYESPIKFNSNLDIHYNSFLKNDNIINNNNNFNSLINIDPLEKQTNNKYKKNMREKLKNKSRNFSIDYQNEKFISSNNGYNENKINSYNINNLGVHNNKNGKMTNFSDIIYNNDNNNCNNFNNSKKDEIIEKRILLKKNKNNQLINYNKTTNYSSNLDVNELYKLSQNNILDISNIKNSKLIRNEINTNLCGVSTEQNNINQNKKNIQYNSFSNLFNNYIYKKKTKKIKPLSLSKKAKEKEENSDFYKKIGIIKLPLTRINISPVKNKINNLKTDRIKEVIKNIDRINLKDKFKNDKNAILQRLLKNNHKNNNNEIGNTNLFLFGIDNKNNMIQFDIILKQYSLFNIYKIKDLSNSFFKDYNYNSSIILNNLKGIYILTGINTNILYYYNMKKKSISKICSFIYSHNSGSLLLDKEKNRIFVFSGKNEKKCEFYSFLNEKVKEISELNLCRINASYAISNNKIFCLFGYSYIKNENINSIEIFDLEKMDKWEIKYLNFKFEFNIERCLNIIFKSEKNKIYLLMKGYKYGESEKRKIFFYDINKNEIYKINNVIIEDFKEEKCLWVKNEEENKDDKGIMYEKCLNFLELPKEINNNYFDYNYENIAVTLDNKNNALFFNKNQMKIEIYRNS